MLPEPTIAQEVAAGALVARPIVGIDLKRPIGIIQRRGKELGKTARRFMQLLMKQSASSREVTESGDAESEDAERPDLRSHAERGNEEIVTDEAQGALAEAKVDAAAVHVAS